MALTRISAALTQRQKLAVVTVEDVKRQGRILENDEDDLIADYIESAYDWLSGPTGWLKGCCLLTEQYELTSSTYAEFEIPLRPLQIGTITFEAWNGTAYEALPAGGFYLEASAPFFTVRRPRRAVWNYTDYGDGLAFRMVFQAGFGDERADIPAPIRQGIKMLAAHWYNNRETVGAEGRAVGQEIRYGLRELCRPYAVAHDPS